MKFSRVRYQHGSVRKVPRSHGFAWEFRYYSTAPDGKRALRVQTFDAAKYPTERDVRKAVEGQLSALNAGTLRGKVLTPSFSNCPRNLGSTSSSTNSFISLRPITARCSRASCWPTCLTGRTARLASRRRPNQAPDVKQGAAAMLTMQRVIRGGVYD